MQLIPNCLSSRRTSRDPLKRGSRAPIAVLEGTASYARLGTTVIAMSLCASDGAGNCFPRSLVQTYRNREGDNKPSLVALAVQNAEC